MDDVEYRESIFPGYRYYDTFHVPVRYCFGYGLSYTQFTYFDLQISKATNESYQISFCIENIGMVSGSEISQLYIKNPQTDDFRANRELKGFEKTDLKPGEKKKIVITIDERAFSVHQNGEFQVIEGVYEIQIGSSLQDIRLSETVEVSGTKLISPLNRNTKVPLCEKDFNMIYSYPCTHFSDMKPGEFTTKNSLIQMAPYSRLARRWIRIGKIVARLTYFPKSMQDPEVRTMTEGILEGNIDSVCNQSGGLIKNRTIKKIVDSANKGAIK